MGVHLAESAIVFGADITVSCSNPHDQLISELIIDPQSHAFGLNTKTPLERRGFFITDIDLTAQEKAQLTARAIARAAT